MQLVPLQLNLGEDPDQVAQTLQSIKDAMTVAVFQKIADTGITDSTDRHFSIWQSIYLEADHRLSTDPNDHC